MKPAPSLAYATLQHVRHTQRIAALARGVMVPILQDASSANDLEIGNFRELGQKIVLNSIRERGVLPVVAQIFKRQDSNTFFRRDFDGRASGREMHATHQIRES